MDQREATLAFALHDGLGYKKISRLRELYGSLLSAWQNYEFEKYKMAGFLEKDLEKWFEYHRNFVLDSEIEKLNKHQVEYVCWWEDTYPFWLKETYGPPAVLFYKGNLDITKQNCVGVVGTRAYTDYGKRVTEELVQAMVKKGLVIVSGLALGIDGIAHRQCIKDNGLTIGVLAGGLDRIYPAYNTNLANEMLDKGGLIISEFPIGVQPQKYFFPARNRIVSGLSRGILVTEAPIKSGALITADFALDQNRVVMAVPAGIFQEKSQGCLELIRRGAALVTGVDDVLKELNIEVGEGLFEVTNQIWEFADEMEKIIYNNLTNKEKYVDELVSETGLECSSVVAKLNLMTIKGMIREGGGGKWSAM